MQPTNESNTTSFARFPETDGLTEITASPLEAWPNEYPDRLYSIRHVIPEFTCLCPLTGQCDNATIVIDYQPAEASPELKSLKGYITTYRNRCISHEAVPNCILDDLVALIHPHRMRVRAYFAPRGTISTIVTAPYYAAHPSPRETSALGAPHMA
jgi:7-cyano-7-deazaguanine reductase